MPWRIAFSRRGQREFDRLPLDQQEAVAAALARLVDNPSSVDLSKLSGSTSQWRLRVGRWRVLLDADNRKGTMRVDRVLDRRDAYRG
jgi:mRNA-degrading endonuclease RelE of RelBE toxin-antitoxin system